MTADMEERLRAMQLINRRANEMADCPRHLEGVRDAIVATERTAGKHGEVIWVGDTPSQPVQRIRHGSPFEFDLVIAVFYFAFRLPMVSH